MNRDLVNETLLLSPAQAAELLGISKRLVWTLTFERATLSYVRIGRRVRYPVGGLRAWVARQTRAQGQGCDA
ncbi:MAG: helix-turn-helix domain-containing protein [Thermoguttaceae bacterium]